MRFNTQRRGLVFVGLIAAILIGLSVVIAVSTKQDKIKDNLQKDPIMKVLFVIEDKNQALFTDVLIYYPETGKGILVNIPGNTGGLYASLDRVDRIDSIYSEKGIETYLGEIEKLIKVEIPFYITISLNDFVELADLLGGFEIFISMPVDERSPAGEQWLLPSGKVSLDGEKVRTFMTYYLNDESEDSIQDRRQDAAIAFLSAIKDKANTYLSKSNFNEIASRMNSNIKEKDLLELFKYISKVDTERFEVATVTGIYNTVDGKSLLMPFRNGEYIKDVVKKLINSIVSPSGTANTRPYAVKILNGTNIKGFAYNTKKLLEGAAIEVLDIGNTESEEEVEETYIINHIGKAKIPEIKSYIGDFIHCDNIILDESKTDGDEESVSNVDITLVLGKDFDGRYVHAKKKK